MVRFELTVLREVKRAVNSNKGEGSSSAADGVAGHAHCWMLTDGIMSRVTCLREAPQVGAKLAV